MENETKKATDQDLLLAVAHAVRLHSPDVKKILMQREQDAAKKNPPPAATLVEGKSGPAHAKADRDDREADRVRDDQNASDEQKRVARDTANESRRLANAEVENVRAAQPGQANPVREYVKPPIPAHFQSTTAQDAAVKEGTPNPYTVQALPGAEPHFQSSTEKATVPATVEPHKAQFNPLPEILPTSNRPSAYPLEQRPGQLPK